MTFIKETNPKAWNDRTWSVKLRRLGAEQGKSSKCGRSPMYSYMTCATYFLPDGYESVVVTTVTVLPLQSVVRACKMYELYTDTNTVFPTHVHAAIRRTEQTVKEGTLHGNMEGETECSTLSPLPLLVTTKVTLTTTLCCPLSKRCKCKITFLINIFESSTDDESTLNKLIGEAVRGCASCANCSGTLGSSRVSSAKQPTRLPTLSHSPLAVTKFLGFTYVWMCNVTATSTSDF